MGPVALLGAMLLLVATPLVRGGDYFIVLLPLEWLSLVVLLALAVRALFLPAGAAAHKKVDVPVAVLLASPLVLALVQLTPLPDALWSALPGHAKYAQALQALGLADGRWRPLTISPDATRASLLAALPLVAAFLVGHLATKTQFRYLARVVVALAFVELALGLLQLSGGEHSPVYFGMMTYGSPIGTMGTRNEFANLLAMALAVLAWLAFDSVRAFMRSRGGMRRAAGQFDHRHVLALWLAAGLLLVVGVLMSRSRAGAICGLVTAFLAVGAIALRMLGRTRGWRIAAPVAAVVVVGAVAMVGLDAVFMRVSGDQLRSAAGNRGDLWRSSLEAAMHFMPLGSGWGTYDIAYRPFQPPSIVGYPNHAHNDYIELLVEGGLVSVAFAALAAWLLLRRAVALLRGAMRDGAPDSGAMLATLCGIGLLGFLLHAAVDFPMRVPGNAVLACLLAGAFLRPFANGDNGA